MGNQKKKSPQRPLLSSEATSPGSSEAGVFSRKTAIEVMKSFAM